jgi:DNA-binding Lrp family transcriptional regulator
VTKVKKKIILDEKDLEIVNALFQFGSNASTKFLSKTLSIPARTINYRMKRLRDNGFLDSYPLINERKLGLGQCCFLAQVDESKQGFPLHKLLEKVPYIYLIASTYGKFNGCLCFAVYSLDKTDLIKNLLDYLKEKKLIAGYYLVDIVDMITGKIDLQYYNAKENKWKWDWENWKQNIQKNLGKEEFNEILNYEENPEIIKFDTKDIQLLRKIKEIYHYETTQISYTSLEKSLQMSDTSIRRRIQRLEKENVIKGYLLNFQVPYYHDTLFTYIFIELQRDSDFQEVISIFHQLPLQINISIESRKKFILFYHSSAKDLSGFLKGMELLKPYFERFFLQIVPFYYNSRHHLFEAYNEESNDWNTPEEEYRVAVEKMLK